MVHIETYTDRLLELLKDRFGKRLVYLGLQGSYLRNEAKENSDIDIMAVIDGLTVEDLKRYRETLVDVGEYEKSCGFLCGKEELAAWNPLEACHLVHTTKDLYGALSEYLPEYTVEDEKNFIRVSVGNLYHELCHRYLYADREKNIARLPAACKQVFYILQNLCFIETGVFHNSKAELLCHLEGQDREVFALSQRLQEDMEFDFDFDTALSLLLAWCRDTLRRL